jgi:hypothetical protein
MLIFFYSKYNRQCPSRLTVRVRLTCDAEKIKSSSDGGECSRKKCKRGYGGVWRSPRLSGMWSQAVCFVLLHLAGIWLQSP